MTKRTGRPPLDPDDPSVRLTLTLQATRYDAVYRLAAAARQSVPEYLRAAIARDLKNQKSPRRAPRR
jgi:ABC-type branched-subunit amino acid transport system substrate-binding protein